MKKTFYVLSIASVCFLGNLYAAELEHLTQTITTFEKYAAKAMKDWEVPGMAIAIVKDDKIVYAEGFGIKEMGSPDKIDPHTIFQIGSISKSFTAALVGMEIDNKHLKWDDSVVNHLPDFRMNDPWVTRAFQIEDTLAQRSGLAEQSLDNLAALGSSRKEMIHALRYIKPVTSFRSAYAYQNVFFLVASEIVELKTEKSWEQLIQERILTPLGMNETSVGEKPFINAKNVAWLHERGVDGKPLKREKPFPFMNWVYTYAPAGGINSNVLDMAKWIMMQSNLGQFEGKQIVSSENIQRMHRPHIFVASHGNINNYYGLGWVYEPYSPYSITWHTGGTSGFSTILGFMPEERVGIVILTNEANNNLPAALLHQFFDLYTGKQDQDWSKQLLAEQKEQEVKLREMLSKPVVDFSPALPLSAYAGTYHNEAFGEIQVVVEKDKLVLIAGKDKVKIPVIHFDRDIFTVVWPEMFLPGTEKIVFGLDSHGNVATLNADLFGKDGNGLFVK